MVFYKGKPIWETEIKPVWEKPPEEIVKGLTAPVPFLGAGGLGAVVSKTIIKGGVIAGGLGLAAGYLLRGGGGTQELKPTQTTDVAPEQTLHHDIRAKLRDVISDLKAKAESKAEVEVAPEIVPTYKVTAGGDVDIGGVTHITTTTTTSGISQDLVGQLISAPQTPQQITITVPTQETKAEQKTDMGLIALLAAAALAMFVLFRGKRSHG